MSYHIACCTLLCSATPILDFIPIGQPLTFTDGQGRGDQSCTNIMIIQDPFVESEEVFEVMLLPNPQDLLGAIIMAGRDRAFVTISDGENNRGGSLLLLLHTCMLKSLSWISLLDVNVQPSTPDVSGSEGGGGGGGGTGGDPQVMVCIELATGFLQRDIAVNVQTESSPTSTGCLELVSVLMQY